MGVAPNREALERVPKSLNSRSRAYQPVNWDDLDRLDPQLTDAIRRQAARYGYAGFP